MTGRKNASLTIFLSLVMMLFITLCLILIEGTRIYFLRVEAMQAVELAEFSVLSEYQQELFGHYGLFFLDLDYEQGSEQTGVLEQRARGYLRKNAEDLTTVDLSFAKFCRATDSDGSVFLKQAVEQMKIQSGYKIFEELTDRMKHVTEEDINLQEILTENQSIAGEIAGEYEGEQEEAPISISLPDISFPSIQALTEAVFGSEAGLSEKKVDLKDRLLNRRLSEGVGGKEQNSFSEMQLFYGYLFRYCGYYGDNRTNLWKESLEYQLEYIISGKGSDLENLENIMWRIFLLRAGGNYLFYHQDAEYMGRAEAEAMALVGFTGNAVLIKTVKEMILISQAIEEGIAQTRQIFSGEKVPLYQNGIFDGIRLGYQEYLYLFLNTTDKKEKIFRCMDIVEMEVRTKSGYEQLRLDHCVDRFELQWKYQFPSLFTKLPLLNGGYYESTIKRKIYYEN